MHRMYDRPPWRVDRGWRTPGSRKGHPSDRSWSHGRRAVARNERAEVRMTSASIPWSEPGVRRPRSTRHARPPRTTRARSLTVARNGAHSPHMFGRARAWLGRPVDPSSLGAFRIWFGLCILVESLRYFDHGWIRSYFIEPV